MWWSVQFLAERVEHRGREGAAALPDVDELLDLFLQSPERHP